MNGFVIFSDLKGFSKLTEPEIRIFYQDIINSLAAEFKYYRDHALVWNTWGDAIVAVYDSGKIAVDFSFAYRNFFRRLDYDKLRISKLVPRIAAHFGEFELFDDPLLTRKNMLGTNINTTARIEPVTRAGEIFVTKQFKEAIEQLPEKVENINFGELGNVKLAKNFGEKEIYRLYQTGENEQIIDRLLKTNLSWALPEPAAMTSEEKESISYYRTNSVDYYQRIVPGLNQEKIEGRTGYYLFELAQVCKDVGLYNKAIDLLEAVQSYKEEVYGIELFPFRHRRDLLKLKANCLTRVGKYEEAADLIYGLWHTGMQDPDTLSMLAAQYKRRALFDQSGQYLQDRNIDLLTRAKELYLEAFRLDIENYYPAINAAYLYKMLGEEGKSNKLANYIVQAWSHREGEDWWMDSTLAEAEVVHADYERAIEKFKIAMDKHKPSVFQLNALKDQLQIFAYVTNRHNDEESILDLIKF